MKTATSKPQISGIPQNSTEGIARKKALQAAMKDDKLRKLPTGLKITVKVFISVF